MIEQKLRIRVERGKKAKQHIRPAAHKIQKLRLLNNQNLRTLDRARVHGARVRRGEEAFPAGFARADNVNDMLLACFVDAMEVDRAGLHNVDALRLVAVAEKIFPLLQRFLPGEFRDPKEILRRQIGQQLAEPSTLATTADLNWDKLFVIAAVILVKLEVFRYTWLAFHRSFFGCHAAVKSKQGVPKHALVVVLLSS